MNIIYYIHTQGRDNEGVSCPPNQPFLVRKGIWPWWVATNYGSRHLLFGGRGHDSADPGKHEYECSRGGRLGWGHAEDQHLVSLAVPSAKGLQL